LKPKSFNLYQINHKYRIFAAMKAVKLIKNRSDIGAGTRGSDLGIDALEVAAINAQNKYFTHFDYMDVDTHNETIYNKVNALFAKRIKCVFEQCERVSKAVEGVLQEGNFAVVLSGDHSSALGSISGVKAKYKDEQLGVIWIDAHADLHSPYTTPSGNVHGMPLAAALNEDNLENQSNEVTPKTASIWENLKKIGTENAKLQPENLLLFGVRDTEDPENHQIEKLNIKNYSVAEIRFRGIEKCLSEAIKKLAHCPVLYISFDVDSLDCDLVSKGTGTPVSKGFDPTEVITIIQHFLSTQKVVCLEITEVNPLLDTKGNKMAETAFDILSTVTDYYLNMPSNNKKEQSSNNYQTVLGDEPIAL